MHSFQGEFSYLLITYIRVHVEDDQKSLKNNSRVINPISNALNHDFARNPVVSYIQLQFFPTGLDKSRSRSRSLRLLLELGGSYGGTGENSSVRASSDSCSAFAVAFG